MNFRSEDLDGMSLIDLVSLLQSSVITLESKQVYNMVQNEADKRLKELKKEIGTFSDSGIDYLFN